MKNHDPISAEPVKLRPDCCVSIAASLACPGDIRELLMQIARTHRSRRGL